MGIATLIWEETTDRDISYSCILSFWAYITSYKLHWLQWLVLRKDASFISHVRWISLTGHNNATPGIVFSECKCSHSPWLETRCSYVTENGSNYAVCVCVYPKEKAPIVYTTRHSNTERKVIHLKFTLGCVHMYLPLPLSQLLPGNFTPTRRTPLPQA
jgi:hypothetical protein